MRHSVRKYFFFRKVIVSLCIFAAVFFVTAGVVTVLNGISNCAAGMENISMAAANTWRTASKPPAGRHKTANSPEPAVSSETSASKQESKAISSSIASRPARSTAAVARGWFKDAVFIGNSRTEGLRNYDGLDGAVYYAQKGLMVDTAYTKKVVDIGGREYSAMQAIKKKHFGKVYLMFGINELGWSSSQTFFDDYGKMVDDIKKDLPDAKIYIQSVMPVSEKKSESSNIYNNAKIKEFNIRLKKLANDKKTVYLDVAGAVSDSGGTLPEGASVDGVHMNSQYCGKWCDYLKTHT